MSNQSKPFSFEGKKTTTAKARPVDEHGNLPVVNVIIKRPIEVALTIGVFFDGTANNSHNTQARRDYQQALARGENPPQLVYVNHTSYENEDTNVYKLFQMYHFDSELNSDNKKENTNSTEYQLRVYIEGAGTETGAPDSNIGMGSGLGATGINAKIDNSINAIKEVLSKFLRDNKKVRIQKLQFDTFGFSRGAATARYFANIVADQLSDASKQGDNNPLTKMLNTVLAEKRSKHWQGATNGQVRFLGVFDTVAGIASFRNLFNAGDANTFDIDISIRPESAQCGLQIQADNEYRRNFSLNDVPPFFKRIIVPGAHSDIGGGYSNHPVSEDLYITLLYQRTNVLFFQVTDAKQWIYAKLTAELARFRRHPALNYLFKGLSEQNFDIWQSDTQGNNNQNSVNIYGTIRIKRQVKPGLDRISLRMMYNEAVSQGCKFMDFDNDYRIPDELQMIADKILQAAQHNTNYLLTEQEKELVLGDYVHCSAEFERGVLETNGEIEILDNETNELTHIPWRQYVKKDGLQTSLLKVHIPHINNSGYWQRQIHPN